MITKCLCLCLCKFQVRRWFTSRIDKALKKNSPLVFRYKSSRGSDEGLQCFIITSTAITGRHWENLLPIGGDLCGSMVVPLIVSLVGITAPFRDKAGRGLLPL